MEQIKNKQLAEQEQIIEQVAKEKLIRNPQLFINFMVSRFPQERHIPYIREWAERFLSCDPLVYMDKESKLIYLEVVKQTIK